MSLFLLGKKTNKKKHKTKEMAKLYKDSTILIQYNRLPYHQLHKNNNRSVKSHVVCGYRLFHTAQPCCVALTCEFL